MPKAGFSVNEHTRSKTLEPATSTYPRAHKIALKALMSVAL